MRPKRWAAACLAFGLVGCSNPSSSQSSHCPTTKDLDAGIVVTTEARIGELSIRYRRLDEAFMGKSYIDGVFANGKTVQTAGLFTYKHWSGGKLVQIEKPETDLSDLYRFEAGTEHRYVATRYSSLFPKRKWKEDGLIKISPAEDVTLGDCVYPAVSIEFDGDTSIFVPELMLETLSPRAKYGGVKNVRKRKASDKKLWPFVQGAKAAIRATE